jgi:hypothetical protein
MSRLILTTNDRAEDVLRRSGLANVALGSIRVLSGGNCLPTSGF